ncbi:MAG TPA: restriction endonuclease subunit S, partial [Polyangium sp.]|nr:restriction endonuclease subunit S [Polyangium sp.]
RAAPEIAAKYKRSEVRSGDLVMSIRATVGTVAVVPAELDGANLTQGTARIAPGPLVEQSFLLAQLRAPGMQQWFTQNVKGATFKEITLGTLRTAPIMLPPLELQQKFSAIAKRLSALSDRQQQAEVTANHLFSSLVDRAFRGELTAPSTSKKKQLDMFEGLGGE